MNTKHHSVKKLTAAILALLLLAGSLCPALAEAFSAVVTSDSMAVYGDALLSRKLDALPKDAVVRVVGYTNSIAKISYDGNTGYVKRSDLTSVDNAGRKAVLSTAAAVYQSPDSNSSSLLVPAGTRLYVLGLTGDWARVERNGYVGYTPVANLAHVDDDWNPISSAAATVEPAATTEPAQASAGVAGTVSAETLKVYKKASTSSKKLGTLKRGQVVNVIKWNKTWAYIELSGHYGFCSVKGLVKGIQVFDTTPAATSEPAASAAQKGTVTAAKLPVYKTASTKGKLLGHLGAGQVVNVVATKDGWAYIELSGHYGFCAVSGLDVTDGGTVPAPTDAPSLSNAVAATVTAASVAVYNTASTSSKKLGTLRKGAVVNVVSWQNGWAYIELNGHYGFCDLSALTRNDQLHSDIPSGFRQETFKATVIRSGAAVYASPSTESASTGIALGSEVTVAGYTSEWACVTRGGAYAYIPVGVLSRADYATVNGDGPETETLLKALLSYGYFDGIPSEKYSSAAVTAIKRFQAACGMSQNGVADPGLQRVLYGGYAPVNSILSTTFASGSKGDGVTRLQTRLYCLGYLSKTGSVDGDYGVLTTAAVKLFQSANGLTSSGKLDPDGMKVLYSIGAKKLPSGLKAGDVTTTTNTTYKGSSYLDKVPAGLESTVSTYDSSMSNPEKLEYVIYVAQNQLGKPYVWGSNGPNQYDCSGLTCYIFKKIGISLKRSAYSQGYDNSYPKITSIGDLRRGDAVYFNTVSDSDLSDHAGIYIGNGYFIHASSGGHRVVVSSLYSGSYYNRVFSWGRRILN